MTRPEFASLQHRARRQERARQWPEPRLFALALVLLTAVYSAVLMLADRWFA